MGVRPFTNLLYFFIYLRFFILIMLLYYIPTFWENFHTELSTFWENFHINLTHVLNLWENSPIKF